MNPTTDELNIKIELATPEDVDGIVEIQRSAWLTTYVNEERGITAEEILAKDFTSLERKERWKKTLREKTANKKIWVAKKTDGETIAFCMTEKDKEYNIVKAIYILQKYQSQGLGKKMMNTALEWLGDEKDIVLDVVDYNTRAIKFYEKLGFILLGKTPAEHLAKLPSGKTMPEIRMIKSAQAIC